MSCLGGCDNCNCQETDICQEQADVEKDFREKLKVLKDYVCVIGMTTCVNLAKMMAKYTYFLWCYLKDITNLITRLDKRVDCLNEQVKALKQFIITQATDKVIFSMTSKGSQSGIVSTTTTTRNDGTFEVKWTMGVGSQIVGNGVASGKVNTEYSVNEDGSIKAKINSLSLNSVKYTNTAASSVSQNANFKIKDKDGAVIFDKTYSPSNSWSENVNKTVVYNIEKDLQANSGDSGEIKMLSTEDTWITDPTYGTVNAKYVNNNSPLNFGGDCPRC